MSSADNWGAVGGLPAPDGVDGSAEISLAEASRELVAGLVEVDLGRGDEVIDRHLATFGRACGADRALLVQIDREAGRAAVTHDWAEDGTPAPRVPGGMPLDLLTGLLSVVARHRPIVLVDRDLVPEDTAVSSRLSAWGLVATVTAPVLVEGSLEGLVVVGWKHPREPGAVVADLTVVAADLLAMRLAHERSHAALEALRAEVERRDAGGAVGRQLAPDVEDPAVPLADLVLELDGQDRLAVVRPGEEPSLPSLGSFVGTPFVELFDPARRAELTASLAELRRTGEVQSFTFRWGIRGVDHLFSCRVEPADAGGGAVVTIRDLTEVRRLQDELQGMTGELAAARAELAEVTRARDEFLASVSHELRTPLNAVLGMAEVLAGDGERPLAPAHVPLVETIDRSGRQLQVLIDDLLALSGLRAQLIEPSLAPVDLGALCREALDAVAARAAGLGIRLELLRVPDEVVVLGDGDHLRQVLDRLLDNALKFTGPAGSVAVHLARTRPGHVDVEVWDSGPGIEPADLERIFEPFTQLDAGLDRRHPGPGLGLSIVRHLVALHGGRLEVDSRPGAGSRFTVVLPAAHPPGGAPVEERPVDRSGDPGTSPQPTRP